MGNPFNCGVYRWLNTLNGKVYVGSSSDIENRRKTHLSKLRTGIHDNPHLQAAWRKYGSKVFEFEILTLCLEENLLWQEQLAIDIFDAVKTGYNIALVAGRPMANRRHTTETKRIMSNSQLGHKVSEESRQAQSKAMKNRVFSHEHRKALANAKLGTKNSEKHNQAIKDKMNLRSPEYKAWLSHKALASRYGKPFYEPQPRYTKMETSLCCL